MESAAGLGTLVAGLWVFVSPLLLGHAGATEAFGTHRTAMVLAALIALTGGVRAVMPLRLRGLDIVTVGLALVLVALPMVSQWGNGSLVVQMNQVVVGVAIALGSVTSVALRSAVIR